MSRRNVVLALALVAALLLTVPAIGGPASPIKLAKKALGLSKKANKRSKKAAKKATAAQAAAASALAKLAGPQPEAVHAQNADHATNADRAGATAALDGFTVLPLVKASPSPGTGSGSDQSAARAASPEIALYGKGPLRIYAKCFGYNDGNPAITAEIFLDTTQSGVVFSSAGEDDSGNTFLDTGAPEDDRQLMSLTSQDAVGNINPSDAESGAFYAIAPDGTTLQGEVHLAPKVGTVTGGDGPFPPGGGCLFTGAVTAS